MKKIVLIGILLTLFQYSPAQNYKFQALFIYNIVKRVNWPSPSDNFVIGVMGSKELQKELIGISKKQKLGGKQIKIINVSSKEELNDIHVLYFSRSSSSKLNDIQAQLKSKPILLIGEKSGLKGVGINFIDNSNEIKFEIYPANIKDHQLTLATSLLSLGEVKQ
ncbi:YfiR family protein [Labilibacter marinus]|uniref:YfiR family protein n=1 Tax=Labilibacter marinus TaxID=1477105 RepID=UPI00094F4B97|nr:YfiR family protein [Labilibacter marinus]